MGRERSQTMRLLVICAAWALGTALVHEFDVGGPGALVPALLAAAAYVATRDVSSYGGGRGGGGGGNVIYYRGRRIDRDRWN